MTSHEAMLLLDASMLAPTWIIDNIKDGIFASLLAPWAGVQAGVGSHKVDLALEARAAEAHLLCNASFHLVNPSFSAVSTRNFLE